MTVRRRLLARGRCRAPGGTPRGPCSRLRPALRPAVPLALWVAAAAAAVALSFVDHRALREGEPGRAGLLALNLSASRGRLLASTGVRLVARLLSVGLLALVLAASLVGDQTPTRNLAPTAIWVAWWVGLAYVSALVGNLWAVVSLGRDFRVGRGALRRPTAAVPVSGMARCLAGRPVSLAFAWVD